MYFVYTEQAKSESVLTGDSNELIVMISKKFLHGKKNCSDNMQERKADIKRARNSG